MSASADAAGCQRKREVRIRQEVYSLPCGARDCDVCGQRWEQDQRVRAVAASEHVGESVALITVTAPGRARFSYGPAGSFDDPVEQMLQWNRCARRMWRRLHLRASRKVRDWARALGCDWRLLYRSWEYQKRGLLHIHLVVPYSTWEQRWCTELYVYNLWSMAGSCDFGFVWSGGDERRPPLTEPHPVKPADGPAVARYVCKYIASTGHGKDSMRTVAERTCKRGSVLYVSGTLTARSGVTMTTLRARRRIWARYAWARESEEEWRIACYIDALQRGNPPLTRESEDGVREQFKRVPLSSLVLGTTGEEIEPTPAPPPLSAVAVPAPAGVERSEVVVFLASVWLGDPERPELGPQRLEVRLVG